MHMPSLADHVACLECHDWNGVARLMLASLTSSRASAPTSSSAPDNTIHQAMPLVLPGSPLPTLDSTRLLARAVGRDICAPVSLRPA